MHRRGRGGQVDVELSRVSALTGCVFNIQRYVIHDGPGIRTTVFFKGCPLRCWWCHNPESHCLGIEKVTSVDQQEDTLGQMLTVADIMQEVEKDVVFFDESGGGVTFSGGEPLMQPEFLLVLLQRCRQQDIHTTVDTCGYAPSDVFQAVLASVDLILFDLKIVDDDRHRQYTGVSNRQIFENLRLFSASGVSGYIRIPIIPGITDTAENIRDILTCIADVQGIEQVNLLPYHRTAEHKYQRLEREIRMVRIKPPSEARMQGLKMLFEAHGFRTHIGG